ncbi:MAG: SRPBCC domain-containing protein [Ginsengibacter sp.]
MKHEPFVIERTYDAPVEKVWKAITDKDQMKEWYFNIETFKPEVGFEFQFEAGSKEKKYLHLCRITDVEANKKLRYSWRYDGVPGNSFVTFELFPDGKGTRLKLTHEGLETFVTDNPDFARESFAKGWNHIIGKSLKEYVEKKS